MKAVNLIPADQRRCVQRRRQERRRASTSCSACSAIVVAMVAALTITKQAGRGRTRRRPTRSTRRPQIATAKAGNLAAYKQFNES